MYTKRHLIVLVRISLRIIDVEHLFVYFLAICTSFWEKYLLKSFVHFLLLLLLFFLNQAACLAIVEL